MGKRKVLTESALNVMVLPQEGKLMGRVIKPISAHTKTKADDLLEGLN